MAFKFPGIANGAALAAIAVAFAPSFAPAQDSKPNLTVILDSSGSMWGQIEGINKVVSARNVLGGVAKKYEGKIDLGLISYGHRRSSGCSDIEVLLKPGAHKASAFSKAVKGVKPKGSTPIAAALAIAAKAADFQSRKASLLLISDGPDNCSGDPCAVAADLKAKSKDLTIHVVGFDRKEQKKLKKLSCVAEATGGAFAPATSEAELLAAVGGIVEKVVAPPELPAVTQAPTQPVQPPQQPVVQATPQQAAPAAPQKATPETTAAVPPAPQRTPEQAPAPVDPQAAKAARGAEPAPQAAASVPVSLSAKLVDGGGAITSGLIWRIFEPKPDPNGKYKLLGTHRTATVNDALPPGEYLVNAAYGMANVTQKIQVQAGQSIQETVILNAGGLRLGAVLSDGQPLAPNSVRYDVFAGDADQFGNRKKILGDAKPGLILRLNAGAYHVVSVYGDANAVVRADVAVEAGRLTEATINHSAAKVTFKLVLQPGGEALADTRWNVLTPGGDVVKESAGALPTHILAAGAYSVLARHGGKNYTLDFSVQPGETRQVEVVIR